MMNIPYTKITFSLFIFVGVLLMVSPAMAQNVSSTGFDYTVQKGDTLWDISKRFYGSPYTWPELWKLNHENVPLYNPHFIYPGQVLRIYPHKDLKVTSDYPPVSEQPFQPQPDFVPGKPGQFGKIEDKDEELSPYVFSLIDQVGFIRETPVSPDGVIFKAREDKELISQGDIVYIRETQSNSIGISKSYMIYRTLKPVKDNQTDEIFGVQHVMVGVVEITGKEPGYAVGTIIRSFRTVYLQDKLMPFKPQESNVSFSPSVKNLTGKIIISEVHAELIGDNMVAFINRGRKDGIIPGQEYSVYYQEKARLDPNSKQEILLAPVDFARFLVLRTEDSTATVVITKTDRDVSPGSPFRSPLE